MKKNRPRIAIIVARYGPGALGGAESLARGFAEEAVASGWEVEVISTCALSPYDWKNILRPGLEKIDGVIVRRFPVHWSNRTDRLKLAERLRVRTTLKVQEQYDWLRLGPQSFPLYKFVLENADNYDLFITLPYLDSIAYHAARGTSIILLTSSRGKA